MSSRPLSRLAGLLLAAALLLGSAPSLYAQDDSAEPLPLAMGQLATGAIAAGESVSYLIDLPENTTYVITTGDDAEAAKFNLVITDRRDREVYNDVFQTTEIDLDDGDHVFTLTATQDATLSLFVTGEIGRLSEDYGEGELQNGSFVTESRIDNTLYATLEIEDLGGWQMAFVNVSGGDRDVYSAYASGEDTYASISDSSIEGPLTFWTQGGDYSLEFTPVEGGDDLTVVVLLSGPVPELVVGEDRAGTFNPGTREVGYRFIVDNPGAQYTVSLSADTNDVDLDLGAAIKPTDSTWTSYSSGSDETLTFVAPIAGEYFVRIFTSSEVEDPVDYTVRVDAGEAAPVLENGVQVWDTVEPGAQKIYTLPVLEGNQFIVVKLAADPEVDLDLSATLVDDEGSVVSSLSSTRSGSLEVMSEVLRDPGIYQVQVSGSYVSDPTPFVLRAEVEPAGAVGGQWAIDATASSQFGDSGYAPVQATGEPNVPEPSDNPLSWASKDPDGGEETLELTFANPVVPTGVRIYESYNPGAVVRIEALDPRRENWEVLWEGSEPTEETIRVFSPAFEAPDFLTTQLRLTLDTAAVPGWNEIDAVQLLGLP